MCIKLLNLCDHSLPEKHNVCFTIKFTKILIEVDNFLNKKRYSK